MYSTFHITHYDTLHLLLTLENRSFKCFLYLQLIYYLSSHYFSFLLSLRNDKQEKNCGKNSSAFWETNFNLLAAVS